MLVTVWTPAGGSPPALILTVVVVVPLTLRDATSPRSEEVSAASAAMVRDMPLVLVFFVAPAGPARIGSGDVGRASAAGAWAGDGVTTGSALADFCPSVLTFVFVCCPFPSAIVVDGIFTT